MDIDEREAIRKEVDRIVSCRLLGPRRSDDTKYGILLALAAAADEGSALSPLELAHAVWGSVDMANSASKQVGRLRTYLARLGASHGSGGPPALTIGEAPYELRVLRRSPAPGHLASPPVADYPFVGRHRELADLSSLLSSERLVTILGPGGVGKTRLASQASRPWARSTKGGVAFARLDALQDPRLVEQACAEALGIVEFDAAEGWTSLAPHFADRSILLILDSCEHVLDAIRGVAGTMLDALPSLRILATSRERLGIEGEQVVPLGPLDVPSDDVATQPMSVDSSDARCLFAGLAWRVRSPADVSPPELRAITKICRRLDGLPLALELAAARVASLGLEGVLESLAAGNDVLTDSVRRRTTRHRSLRETIEWSFRLLEQQELDALLALAPFVGGATADSAAFMWSTDPRDATRLLITLAEKSLLSPRTRPDGSARYVMLETIRAHALERLAAGPGLAGCRARHAEYFASLVRSEAGGVLDADGIARLNGVREDILAAIEHLSTVEPAPETELATCLALTRYWPSVGRWTLGRDLLLRALGRSDARPRERAAGLHAVGTMEFLGGDCRAAVAHLTEAVALRRQIEDDEGLAASLGNRGMAAFELTRLEAARRDHEESLALSERLGRVAGITISLNNLGNVCAEMGDHARARECYERSLDRAIHRDDRAATATAQANLGILAFNHGAYAEALAWLRAALREQRQAGNLRGEARALVGMAHVAVACHRDARAAVLYGRVQALAKLLDERVLEAAALDGLGDCALARGDHPRARACLLAALSIRWSVRTVTGVSETLRATARSLAVASPHAVSAARLMGAEAMAREVAGFALGAAEETERREILDLLEGVLGRGEFEHAWASGRAMPLGAAVALAFTLLGGSATGAAVPA